MQLSLDMLRVVKSEGKVRKQYFLSLFQLQQNQSMDKADKFSTEVKMLRSENALLQDELRRAKVPSIYYVGTHKGRVGTPAKISFQWQ